MLAVAANSIRRPVSAALLVAATTFAACTTLAACPRAVAAIVQVSDSQTPGRPETQSQTVSIRGTGSDSSRFASPSWRLTIPYQAPSAKYREACRQAFQEAVRQLDKQLSAAGPEYYRAWSRYLHFAPIIAAVQAGEEPALSDVQTFRRWLFSNQRGVDATLFAAVRETVLPYEATRFAWSIDDLPAAHQHRLLKLSEAWVAYANQPELDEAIRLQEQLFWFGRTGTGGDELEREFAEHRRSNLVFAIPASMLRTWIQDDFYEFRDDRQVTTQFEIPLRRSGRPTPMSASGTASTWGAVDFELLPASDAIRLLVRFNGQTQARTRSEVNRLQVSTTMLSDLKAQGTVLVQPSGVAVRDVAADAELQDLQFRFASSHRSPRVGSVVESFAERLLATSRVQSSLRTQVIEHFQREMATQFREEVQQAATWRDSLDIRAAIAQQNAQLAEIVAPLNREGVNIEIAELASQPDRIRGGFRLQSRAALTTSEVPHFEDSDEIQVAMHESFVNNLFTQVWGGKWIADDYLERASQLIYSAAPYELYTHERKERWAMRLPEIQPLTFRWQDAENMRITLRVQAYRYRPPGSEAWLHVSTPMRYTAVYRIATNSFGDVSLERKSFQAEVDSATPRLDQTPSAEAEQAARFLERQEQRMAGWLGPSIDFGGIAIPEGGELSQKLQQFQLQDWNMQAGWLHVRLTPPANQHQPTRESASVTSANIAP